MKVREAVELLGGPSAVGRELSVDRKTVTTWCDKNQVGERSRMRFMQLAKKYGVAITINEVCGK